MIWYEIDGGAAPVPSGYGGGSTTERRETMYNTSVKHESEWVGGSGTQEGMTAEGSTWSSSRTESFDSVGFGATEVVSQEHTMSASESRVSANEEGVYASYSRSATSSASGETSAETAIAAGSGGGMSHTVRFTITGETSWSESYSTARTWEDTEGSHSSSTTGTASGISTTSQTGSTTYSYGPLGMTRQVQTTTTAAATHHGSTTATTTATQSQITDDGAGSTITTAVTVTRLTTASHDYTVTQTVTTTAAGTILAGHVLHTVIIADPQHHLFVAPEIGYAGNMPADGIFAPVGHTYLAKPNLEISGTGAEESSTYGADEVTTFLQTGTWAAFGVTASFTSQMDSSADTEGRWNKTVNGQIFVAPSGYAVGLIPTNGDFYFPEFGESGVMTFRLRGDYGPATVSLTLMPRDGTESSTMTVTVGAGQTVDYTFESGINVASKACMAGTGGYAVADFRPWYVLEAPCTDGFLTPYP